MAYSHGQAALAVAVQAGNINIGGNNVEVMDLTTRSLQDQERQAMIRLELQVQRLARTVHVPTLQSEIITQLRAMGHPITLFGERAEDRRERLKMVVARKQVESDGKEVEEEAAGRRKAAGSGSGAGSQAETRKEVSYYKPKTAEQLKRVRQGIATFSFERARKRLRVEREMAEPEASAACDAAAAGLVAAVKRLEPTASQVGDARRPLNSCSFSPDAKMIATGSWSCLVKLWNADCSARSVLRGHTERVCDVVFHPDAKIAAADDDTSVHLASGGADSVVHLWSLGGSKPVCTLKGHAARLAKVRFHPSGRCLASTSFDKTWRLWDLETNACVQLQEGHSKETYALAMHGDGSLVSTGDLGGIGRVWDLRSGKSIMVLHGHVRQLLSMDFAPNGIHLATGSDDNTVRIWDLRKKGAVYTIPAHTKLISAVKYAPGSGEFLVTSSYDGTIKSWSARDWSQLGEMTGHEGKISCVDVAGTGSEASLVSCSFDRTFKLWTSGMSEEEMFAVDGDSDADMTA